LNFNRGGHLSIRKTLAPAPAQRFDWRRSAAEALKIYERTAGQVKKISRH